MNEFFIGITVLRGSNGFIYRKILFGDRVPLRTSPGAHVFYLMLFMNVPSPNMTREYEICAWLMVHHEAGARVGQQKPLHYVIRPGFIYFYILSMITK